MWGEMGPGGERGGGEGQVEGQGQVERGERRKGPHGHLAGPGRSGPAQDALLSSIPLGSQDFPRSLSSLLTLLWLLLPFARVWVPHCGLPAAICGLGNAPCPSVTQTNGTAWHLVSWQPSPPRCAHPHGGAACVLLTAASRLPRWGLGRGGDACRTLGEAVGPSMPQARPGWSLHHFPSERTPGCPGTRQPAPPRPSEPVPQPTLARSG